MFIVLLQKVGIKWGDLRTHTANNSYYPNLYAKENGSGINTTNVKKDGIGPSDSYYSSPSTDNPAYSQASTKGLTVTQTYYLRTMDSKYYSSSEFFNLIHNNGKYWLASRYILTISDFSDCGLRCIFSHDINGYVLFHTYIKTFEYSNYLRPVVTLKQNIEFSSGDGSYDKPYQIK